MRRKENGDRGDELGERDRVDAQVIGNKTDLVIGYAEQPVCLGSELLAQAPRPTEAQIRSHMNGHLCRCGTYPRITKAIQLAATRMAGDAR